MVVDPTRKPHAEHSHSLLVSIQLVTGALLAVYCCNLLVITGQDTVLTLTPPINA